MTTRKQRIRLYQQWKRAFFSWIEENYGPYWAKHLDPDWYGGYKKAYRAGFRAGVRAVSDVVVTSEMNCSVPVGPNFFKSEDVR